MLHEILSTEGYAVAEAKDIEQLLQLAQSFNPDLVVLDLHMAAIDAAVEPLRRMKFPERLPLIGLSPEATQSSPERTVEAELSACLIKPISPFELRSCISGLLAAKK